MRNFQRQRKIRSIDLAFKPSLTEDEYQELVEAAKWRGCPHCGDLFNVTLGFEGPDTGKGTRYCSPVCVRAAEVASQPLIKTAPPVVSVDGYDV